MDDPHDAIRAGDTHGWCFKCDEHREMCNCDRSLPDGAGIIIAALSSVFIGLIVIFGMWLL